MEINTDCGIYAILNTVNQKYYLGSSVNILARWSKHKHDLRKGVHINRYLLAAWNKYGECSFEFTILSLHHAEDLVNVEQNYLDIFRPYEKHVGYNISPSSSSNRGVIKGPLSDQHRLNCGAAIKKVWECEEYKEKMSKMHKERFNNPEARAVASQVMLDRWQDSQYVSRRKEQMKARAKTIEGKEHLAKANKAAAISSAKFYIVSNPLGDMWLVHNLSAFCGEFNLKRGSLSDVISGKAPSCHGWAAKEATLEQKTNWNGERFKDPNLV